MAQAEKNTCQLFIQTDHLFYKYYKTSEAVIAQVHRTAAEATFTQQGLMLSSSYSRSDLIAVSLKLTEFLSALNGFVKRLRLIFPPKVQK